MVVTTMSSRIAALCVGLVALGAISGCSFFAEDELPTLAREQRATDALPSQVTADFLANGYEPAIDLESVRLAGEHAGVSVYLAHDESAKENCIVLVATDPDSWSSSCSESTELMSTIEPGVDARTTTDGIIPKNDGERAINTGPWVVLTEDVIVREVMR